MIIYGPPSASPSKKKTNPYGPTSTSANSQTYIPVDIPNPYGGSESGVVTQKQAPGVIQSFVDAIGQSTGSTFGGNDNPPPRTPQPKIPKFDDIVGLDPMVVGAEHNKSTQSALYDNMLQQLRQQLIIQLGEPEFASKLGFAVDPNTADLARKNTESGLSALGRINFNSSQALKAMINQLAGNGIIFSGETGYQQGLNERQRAQNIYDAEVGVQNQLTSALNDNLARKQALDDAIFQARQYAYNNYLNNPLSYATALGKVTYE